MKTSGKISLWIVGVAFVCFLSLFFDSENSDKRLTKRAIRDNLPVEEAKPKFPTNAEKIAELHTSNKVDTVFLGYYFGMTKADTDAQTAKNVAKGKLKNSYGKYTYNLSVFNGTTEVAIPMNVKFNFFDDKLYQIDIHHTKASYTDVFDFTDIYVDYWDALKIIDDTLRDNFLSEGRYRIAQPNCIYYFKGSSEIYIMRDREVDPLGDVATTYALSFIDIHLNKMRMVSTMEQDKITAGEKAAQDELTKNNLKKKAASDF